MMFVTAGLAIAGAVAVLVPILIHLLSRRRRRPIEWAAMRFLLEAFRRHRRRLRLEQLLLLAVRCLIVALLGLALARPILEGGGLLRGAARAVFLVIDNGLMSGLRYDDGRTALERHVAEAVELVESLEPGDVVGVVAAARPAEALLIPPSGRHGAVIEVLKSIEPTDSPTDLGAALTAVRGALDELDADRDQVLVYLLSDFRRGSAALERPMSAALANLGDRVTLLAAAPAVDSAPNVQVVSIEPRRVLILPGSSGQVTVRLARHGGELVREVTQVKLTGDDVPVIEPKLVHWELGQSQADIDFMVDYAVHTDAQVGLSAHVDDDDLAADNQRHAVIDLRSRVRIVLIEPRSFGLEPAVVKLTAGQWVRRALEPAAGGAMEVIEVTPAALDAVDLRSADVALLTRPDLVVESGWTIVREFVDRGGLLIVLPPAELNVHQWCNRLVEVLDLPWRIALEVVDQPQGLTLADEQPPGEWLRMVSNEIEQLVQPVVVYRTLPVDIDQTQAERVMVFSDGSPMVIAGAPRAAAVSDAGDGSDDAVASKGLVVYFSVSLQLPPTGWTNLPSQPLMVPLVHEIVRQGLGMIRAARLVEVGEQPALALGRAAAELVGPQSQRITLQADGRPQRPFKRAGLYAINDRASQRIGALAVNIDPTSARTDVQDRDAVAAWLGRSGPWQILGGDRGGVIAALSPADSGLPIASILLGTVLALVILETLLARWFSHARQVGTQRPGSGRWPGLRPTVREGLAALRGASNA